jgi:hypothetical protein
MLHMDTFTTSKRFNKSIRSVGHIQESIEYANDQDTFKYAILLLVSRSTHQDQTTARELDVLYNKFTTSPLWQSASDEHRRWAMMAFARLVGAQNDNSILFVPTHFKLVNVNTSHVAA